MAGALRHMVVKTSVICGLLLVGLIISSPPSVMGATCTGATYKSPAFDEEVTEFSPFDTIYLNLNCTGLAPGEHVMHANWLHSQRGMIRSDSHAFSTEDGNKRGLYFWFKLSKKGPVASMLSNQDFHEENFGDWTVEAYLNDELVLSLPFVLTD